LAGNINSFKVVFSYAYTIEIWIAKFKDDLYQDSNLKANRGYEPARPKKEKTVLQFCP
jgi:hypothetical protein